MSESGRGLGAGRRKYCGARKRQGGGTCTRPAGWGTDHVGFGVCKFHLGSTKNQVTAAKRAQADELVKSFGLPIDVGPIDAITQELHRTAGAVAWLSMIVADLELGDITMVQKSEIETSEMFGSKSTITVEGKPAVWVDLWQTERRHLVQVSAAAHKMGIDVQQTKLIETAGQMLAAAIMRILDRLGLSDDQQVMAGQVVPDVLRSLEPAEAARS